MQKQIQKNDYSIIDSLMPVDKAWLVTGRDHWRTSALPHFGIRSLMTSDGPHGLRNIDPDKEHKPFGDGDKATCFPAACTSACSWDKGLMLQIGRALATESKGRTDLLLGPGINIKRSPLGGRNFEYFSEDPYLSGQLAAAWVEGLQSEQIGACLKHYAVNSQETRRMLVDAVVDLRALHEIYLNAFEHVIRKARPWSVMASYNKINGTYACEHEYLLKNIMRDKWKFNGVLISDWGAVNNRLNGLKAGLDLEMPGSGSYHVGKIVKAIRKGELDPDVLDRSVSRMLELHDKCNGSKMKRESGYEDEHHFLALRAAEQSMVLVKNDKKTLPLKLNQRIAVIGDFAENPRIQGQGSSRVNPYRQDDLLSALRELELDFTYARGFEQNKSEPDQDLIREALDVAGSADIAVVCIGLPDFAESEGFDRIDMKLPKSQQALLDKLWTVQPRLVAVYFGGSPVELPWVNRFQAVLLAYLGGQAAGTAAARLLLGLANPSGKLAETWPLKLEDTPSASCFPGDGKSVEYRESIYVGYRYYVSAQKQVLWPFGFGLSYSSFEWSGLSLDRESFFADGKIQLNCYLKNVSSIAGSEVVQIYVSSPNSPVDRPAIELKAFAKVFLEPGETRMVSFTLESGAFARYDDDLNCWVTDPGRYDLLAGSSSHDIWLRTSVTYGITEEEPSVETVSARTGRLDNHGPRISVYDRIASGRLQNEDYKDSRLLINSADFTRRMKTAAKMLAENTEKISRGRPDRIGFNTPINDLGSSKLARRVMLEIFTGLQKAYDHPEKGSIGERQLIATWEQTPLRSIALLDGRDMDLYRLDALISMLNGRVISGGLRMLIRRAVDRLDEISKAKDL